MSSTRIWGRIEGVVSNSLLLSGIALLLSSPALATQNVTLAWNASTDPTVVGYNIYYGGASATYTNTLSAGNATNLTVSGLVGQPVIRPLIRTSSPPTICGSTNVMVLTLPRATILSACARGIR